jgi:hypothetical protein
MRLGKYTKTPEERKRYTIDYTDWLDSGETVTTITYEVTFADDSAVTGSAVEIDESGVDADSLGGYFFAAAGEDGEQYKVVATMTTTGGQVREDAILFNVREA